MSCSNKSRYYHTMTDNFDITCVILAINVLLLRVKTYNLYSNLKLKSSSFALETCSFEIRAICQQCVPSLRRADLVILRQLDFCWQKKITAAAFKRDTFHFLPHDIGRAITRKIGTVGAPLTVISTFGPAAVGRASALPVILYGRENGKGWCWKFGHRNTEWRRPGKSQKWNSDEILAHPPQWVPGEFWIVMWPRTTPILKLLPKLTATVFYYRNQARNRPGSATTRTGTFWWVHC